MSKHPRLVVFDLDGTIIDSRHAMRASFEAAAVRVLGPATEAMFGELEARQGRPFSEICAEVGWPPEFAAAFVEESQSRASAVRIFSEIEPVLAAPTLSDVAFAVLTGKDRLRSQSLLEQFSLTARIEAMVCGDDDVEGKPSPAGLFHLMDSMGSCTDTTVYIGDSPVDAASAQSAGVPFLGVRWPGQPQLFATLPEMSVATSADSLLLSIREALG